MTHAGLDVVFVRVFRALAERSSAGRTLRPIPDSITEWATVAGGRA